ncbi:nipblb [Symbiodinium pilosum]|uniref:Nipblb protein n=1 Tax=Symbiodinium pilosum TaxID=2952 RepID=A0A812VN55_SYMPI|nr:nipblb [Symbiodinium pilosum]
MPCFDMDVTLAVLVGLCTSACFVLRVDIADLYLPPHKRCSEDSYLQDPLKDVCMQFMMDVTRGIYVVKGVRYDFEETLARSGLDVETQSLEVESLKEVFASNVAADVQRQLVESDAGQMAQQGANQLVQAVTALMSQSGLANIERACGEHVIVSGGDQELTFELKPGPPRCWDLILSCKKFNFASFMLSSRSSRSDEAEVLACSRSSQILRFALVRFAATNHLQPLSVEVLLWDLHLIAWAHITSGFFVFFLCHCFLFRPSHALALASSSAFEQFDRLWR